MNFNSLATDQPPPSQAECPTSQPCVEEESAGTNFCPRGHTGASLTASKQPGRLSLEEGSVHNSS